MCIFCAAIPATLAVGVKVNAQQQAEACKNETGPRLIPVRAVTAVAVAGLVVASIAVHTQSGG